MDIAKSLYTGKLVRLTGIEAEKDAEALADWSKDATLARMLDIAPARPLAPEFFKKQFERIEKEMDEKHELFRFHIRPLGEEKLIGWAEIYWILWPSQIADIRLVIAPSEQKKGYGSDALKLMLRIAFDELNLHRLAVKIPEYDIPGIKFAKKFGFSEEVRRREVIFRDGRRWDSLIFSLLRPEWSGSHE
jgi:RimJ/RimL family protein N-acetyltransferase